MTQSTNTNQPVFTYRIGSVSATIWPNQVNDKTYYSTEIVRNYKDKDGKWQTSSSFGHDELLNVAKVAERAETYIAQLHTKS